MSLVLATLLLGLQAPSPAVDPPATVVLRLPLGERRDFDVADLVAALSRATGAEIDHPAGTFRLPADSLGAPLVKTLLGESLGPEVVVEIEPRTLIIRLPASRIDPALVGDWRGRLQKLVDQVDRERKRRDEYGMHALKSYRPRDPSRPTVVLIHGLNSTSSVFWHMIGPIEEAGYGIAVYDFPYNRDLDESAEAFRRDWVSFRKAWGETRPFAIVAHSMGSLLARSYVEDDAFAGDVSSLILVAPVNGGSNLTKAQTLLQVIQGARAVNGPADKGRGDALAHLGDGLGAAAEDMTPGSAFLKALAARPRRAGVPYHIVAGSGGFLSKSTRLQVERQLGLDGRASAFGNLVRLAAGNLSAQLDEITEGSGDGCVSLAATRLDGVDDRVILPANHLELIRAPLLYPDPGPIACMPDVLRWLAKDLPAAKAPNQAISPGP